MIQHKRFLQQAAWTKNLRSYLFDKAGISEAHRILEVGCGTAVILAEVDAHADRASLLAPLLVGVDLDHDALLQAAELAPSTNLNRADALSLPFADRVFDIAFCHFLLMWFTNPLEVLLEMKRVTRQGGSVLAIAEPDYRSRIDRPDEFVAAGKLQNEALERQGAHVALGSHLADLVDRAGIRILETGVIESWPEGTPSDAVLDDEWEVLRDDLAGSISAVELARLKDIDSRGRASGQRTFHVPTYFAWGQV